MMLTLNDKSSQNIDRKFREWALPQKLISVVEFAKIVLIGSIFWHRKNNVNCHTSLFLFQTAVECSKI